MIYNKNNRLLLSIILCSMLLSFETYSMRRGFLQRTDNRSNNTNNNSNSRLDNFAINNRVRDVSTLLGNQDNDINNDMDCQTDQPQFDDNTDRSVAQNSDVHTDINNVDDSSTTEPVQNDDNANDRVAAKLDQNNNDTDSRSGDEDEQVANIDVNDDLLSPSMDNNEAMVRSFRKIPVYGFKDIIDGVPNRVRDFIMLLKSCRNITDIKNKNLILSGKPGSGKTTLAQAIAKELNMKFYYLNAGTLITSFQGSASTTLDTIFKYIENRKEKSVIFIDEIDAIVNDEIRDSNGEMLRATRALQCLLDGSYAISIFATNYPDKLPEVFKNRCANISVPLPAHDAISLFIKNNLINKHGIEVDHISLSEVLSNIKEVNYRDAQRIMDYLIIIYSDNVAKVAAEIAKIIVKNNSSKDIAKITAENNIKIKYLDHNDYVIAKLKGLDCPINLIDEMKILIEHYLSCDDKTKKLLYSPGDNKIKKLKYKEHLDELSKKMIGFRSSDIENAITYAKSMMPQDLDFESLYVGIHYDQVINPADSDMKIRSIKYFLKDYFTYKITDYVYQDIVKELVDFTSKDIRDFVYHAKSIANGRDLRVVTASDLYIGLYHVLESKRKPYAVSVNINTVHTPVSDSNDSTTTGMDGGINVNVPGFNFIGVSGRVNRSKTTSESNHNWIHRTTRFIEEKELAEGEKFVEMNIFGDSNNKKTRLDYHTKKLPGFNFRLKIIKYLLNNESYNLDKRVIKKFAIRASGLSFYSINKIIKNAKIWSNQGSNDYANSYESKELIFDNFIKAAKELNMDFDLYDHKIQEEEIESRLKYNSKIAYHNDNKMLMQIDTSKDISNRLIELFVKIEDINAKDKYGRTLLNKACQLNLFGINFIRFLIQKGADVNMPDNSGNTPLVNLVRSNRWDSQDKIYLVKMLKNNSAEINVKDCLGYPLLHIAATTEDSDLIISLISKGCNINALDNAGNNALMHLIKSNKYQKLSKNAYILCLFSQLINTVDQSKHTPLMLAILYNDYELVESLITLEADVNAKQSDGYTPLMLVSRMKLDSSKPSITMYSQSLSHIVDLLIKNNADVNVKDDNGNTALIHSVNCNNKIVLDKLLRDINDKAIDINLENKEKQTALMRSVMNNNIDIFKSLIKHDASLNIKNKDGKNLLMLAIEYKCTSDSQDVKDNYDIIENIIKLGVIDLNDKDNNSVTVEDMARKSGKKNVIDLISSNSSKGSCIVS